MIKKQALFKVLIPVTLFTLLLSPSLTHASATTTNSVVTSTQKVSSIKIDKQQALENAKQHLIKNIDSRIDQLIKKQKKQEAQVNKKNNKVSLKVASSTPPTDFSADIATLSEIREKISKTTDVKEIMIYVKQMSEVGRPNKNLNLKPKKS